MSAPSCNLPALQSFNGHMQMVGWAAPRNTVALCDCGQTWRVAVVKGIMGRHHTGDWRTWEPLHWWHFTAARNLRAGHNVHRVHPRLSFREQPDQAPDL